MATDEDYDYNYNELENTGIIANIKNNLDLVTLSDWGMIFLIAVSILLMSGLIFIFTEAPDFIGRDPRGTQIVYNLPAQAGRSNFSGLSNMYIFELIVVSVTISLGVVGLYLMKNATRFVDEREKGVQILAIGVAFFLIALIFLFLLYNFKQTGQFPNITGIVE